MYYNFNKQANDYYNSYKREIQELEAYEKQDKIQLLIKVVFLFSITLILGLVSYYLYGYFNSNIKTTHKIEKTIFKPNKKLLPIVIREENLPKSPQLIAYQKEQMKHIQESATDTAKTLKIDENINTEKTTTISKKDIALIVQIIMTQINTKKELSLEEQLTAVESTKFTQKELKESNHYNKVVLNNNKPKDGTTIQNNELVELTSNLNQILEEPIEDKIETKYSSSIKEELAYRENEMRVIVVKKGDTLSRIAKRAYGDYNDYPKIFSANPEIIKNPDQIYEGMKLRIPS